jgi:hypothetical protein
METIFSRRNFVRSLSLRSGRRLADNRKGNPKS